MEQTAQLEPSDDYRSARNIREKRRMQASALTPGALLVVFGLLALVSALNDQSLALWQAAALLVVGSGLSFVARFVVYGREEAGLMFLGATIALTAAASLAAWYFAPKYASLPALWPAGLIVIGASLILTLLLSARRDRRLLLPGLSFMTAGAAALPFTLGFVPPEVVEWIAVHWPLVFAVVGLAALTSVLRRREVSSS